MSKPELTAPPELYYNSSEARKYTTSSRIIQIQRELAERAVELLALPPDRPAFLLDIGCGSGLSGELLSESGHVWVGCDVSRDMLEVAVENETGGDVLCEDMGHGLPFRMGTFDGAISISALQWLCYAQRKDHDPRRRLVAFFQSLYNCLRRGARAVLQFYPDNPEQVELITSSAMRCGFTGGLVIDFPHSAKAKKHYLTLFAGHDPSFQVPRALGAEGGEEEEDAIAFERRRQRDKRRRDQKRPAYKSRDWIVRKKEQQRKRGAEVRRDSRYTGRKRRDKLT